MNSQRARRRGQPLGPSASTQIFKPQNERQLMCDWLKDAERYNKGAALEAENFVLNTGRFGNGRRWLSDMAASIIRHIIFTFKEPIHRFGVLLNCFAALLLRKSLKHSDFLDTRSLNRRLLRLSLFDSHRDRINFNQFIIQRTPNGFSRNFYSITVDSKHHKLD